MSNVQCPSCREYEIVRVNCVHADNGSHDQCQNCDWGLCDKCEGGLTRVQVTLVLTFEPKDAECMVELENFIDDNSLVPEKMEWKDLP